MITNSFGPATGKPVLLLHGGGVAGWMWTSLRRSLETSHRVLVPDLPGHGESSSEPYVSHAATIEALAQLLVTANTGPVAVAGFSLGAQLAIELAATHPELVDRVMVVSAQAKPLPLVKPTLALLGLTAPLARKRWFARLQARELFIPEDLMESYIATSAGIGRETLLAAVEANLRFTLPEKLSDFPGRAIVLAGARERTVMRDSALAIHAELTGSELELVPGCGHGIPLQRPDWFNARALAWLSRP
ncbi:alpha/beta hydrolase [Paeniglutamicibacter psychrophenolicus]|uniref:Pimeloyl-ACP methyl ester carboxylesterase n=1 Tax=Paeniglutamicibacter psychrophenolicus TaxID=257454 RepID=A0ABS4WEA3_9MICC|nr:alpha/beta hydrolase [Paeniglutamicibacter psychrophenolicus]MBP2374550.1 pimeloyl-ACP methyl ester carboxylesterase [Paeniglutamicibacter psychrophenolicus]